MTKKSFKTVTLTFIILASFISAAVIAALVFLSIKGVKNDIFGHRKQSMSDISPISPISQSADRGEFYIRNTVFVGDSVILGMKNAGVLPDGDKSNQIWCGEGGDLALDYNINSTAIIYPESGMAISIPEAASEKRPARMIITIGIRNGVPYCTEDSFKAYYKKLVKEIQEESPDTVIILQSVFPTSKKYQKSNSAITTEKIDVANRWISEVAKECRVGYLDTCSILKDSDGYLRSEYDSGDGLHLSAEGYRAVLYYIRTHGYK